MFEKATLKEVAFLAYIWVMEIKELHNYTPHVINLVDNNGTIYKAIESSGIARCDMIRQPLDAKGSGDIKVNVTLYNTTTGLPAEKEGVYYIVSKPVAQFTIGLRSDLLITDEVFRRHSRVIGCRSLAQMRHA